MISTHTLYKVGESVHSAVLLKRFYVGMTNGSAVIKTNNAVNCWRFWRWPYFWHQGEINKILSEGNMCCPGKVRLPPPQSFAFIRHYPSLTKLSVNNVTCNTTWASLVIVEVLCTILDTSACRAWSVPRRARFQDNHLLTRCTDVHLRDVELFPFLWLAVMLSLRAFRHFQAVCSSFLPERISTYCWSFGSDSQHILLSLACHCLVIILSCINLMPQSLAG